MATTMSSVDVALNEAMEIDGASAAMIVDYDSGMALGTAGGGMVTATMTGAGELTALVIDPRAVDPDDVETLQDLVVAAVRDASRAATELSEETMAPISGGAAGLPGL